MLRVRSWLKRLRRKLMPMQPATFHCSTNIPQLARELHRDLAILPPKVESDYYVAAIARAAAQRIVATASRNIIARIAATHPGFARIADSIAEPTSGHSSLPIVRNAAWWAMALRIQRAGNTVMHGYVDPKIVDAAMPPPLPLPGVLR